MTKRHKRLIELLTAERKKRGLRQDEVARALRQRQSWISRIEMGERRIDVIEFLSLADAIGFDPGQIINEIRKKPANEIAGSRRRPREK